jgi:hypothetical protein
MTIHVYIDKRMNRHQVNAVGELLRYIFFNQYEGLGGVESDLINTEYKIKEHPQLNAYSYDCRSHSEPDYAVVMRFEKRKYIRFVLVLYEKPFVIIESNFPERLDHWELTVL